MTYAAEKDKLSRKPFTIIKIEMDTTISDGGAEYHCYGVTPFGQLFYSHDIKNGYNPTPTKMSIASGLGFRGHISVKLNDFSFGDTGTYFGRLLANNPYYLDRKIKVYTGFYDGVTFDWANFKEHLYFIKKIVGPDSKGFVTITAADPLTLLDDDQAQAPAHSDGTLAGPLTDSATGTISVTDNTGFDSGGGVANFDGELVKYSGLSAGTSLVVTERGSFGSEAKAHEADEAVRNCYHFDGLNVVDVVRSLIEDFSPIDHANYIDDTAWNLERDNYLIGDLVTGVISDPTDVKSIVEDLCKQAWLSLWWDDTEQTIKLKAIGPNVTANTAINKNEHILESGEKQKRDPTKAISEVWIYYGRIDLSKDATEPKNYSSLYIDLDADATTGHLKPKIKKIFAKAIPASGGSSVSKLASRILSQNKIGLHEYAFELDIKDADVTTGEAVTVSTDLIQGVDGVEVPTNFMVVERDKIGDTKYQYKAIKTGFLEGANYGVVAPNGTLDYLSETAENKAKYCFIASDVDSKMSNDDDPTLII
jgi:hypothetical protein